MKNPNQIAIPKRFYTAASVQQNGEDFCITLDGKTIKTPKQQLLRTKSATLAQQIAAEWHAQGEHIDSDTMPLTRLLTIALDRVPADRDALLEDIVRYCETDLLCYREPAEQALPLCSAISASDELASLQQKHFTPVLAWCSKTYGVQFAVAEGVMPVAQPPETLQKLRVRFAEARDHELAALAMMVPLLGSALLALALWKGAISVEEALIACRLDETVQAQHWGEDAHVATAWAARARDIKAAAFFLTQKQ